MSKIILLIFLGAVGFATCQYRGNVERPQPTSYDELRQKFVMYRVLPMNNQQVEALKEFCNSNPDVSIFSKIEDPGAGIDVLIKYSEMVSILGNLKRNTGIRQMNVLDKNVKMTFSRFYSPPSRNGNNPNGPNQMQNNPEFGRNSPVIPSFRTNAMDTNNPNFGPTQRNNYSSPGQVQMDNFGPNQMDEDDEDDNSFEAVLGYPDFGHWTNRPCYLQPNSPTVPGADNYKSCADYCCRTVSGYNWGKCKSSRYGPLCFCIEVHGTGGCISPGGR